jgi:hypothetical protein
VSFEKKADEKAVEVDEAQSSKRKSINLFIDANLRRLAGEVLG